MANPLPPPHPSSQIVNAQRFFSRLRTFDLECPHCGLVYLIRFDTSPGVWNRRQARFTCRGKGGCGYQYTLGVLAWPVGRSSNSTAIPADQVPGPRQLAQLRTDGDGWWMTEQYRHKGRPDPTNLAGEADRPEAEDASDLQLLDAEEPSHCEECYQAYNPLKSKAKAPQRYCGRSCEVMDGRD